jgi:hypothetical protein
MQCYSFNLQRQERELKFLPHQVHHNPTPLANDKNFDACSIAYHTGTHHTDGEKHIVPLQIAAMSTRGVDFERKVEKEFDPILVFIR